MAARTVVVLGVTAQDAAQVRFAQGNEVVKTLSTNAPDRASLDLTQGRTKR
jgi:hypothetical protein